MAVVNPIQGTSADPTANESILYTNGFSTRLYTNDPTWGGYVVNIAVLQQNMNTITQPDAYIVNLNPRFLSYAGFKAMFYSQGTQFSPTPNLTNVLKNPTGSQYVLNGYRTYSVLPTDCGQCQLTLDGSFNLLLTLLEAYTTDLQLATECWDTCSLLEFTNIIDSIKGLTDITGQCGTGVKCSITLDEFFAQLQAQGMQMSGNPWYLPVDPSNNTSTLLSVDGIALRPSVYPGLVTAVITANFHSTTPNVKDVQVRWPFIINFTSVITDDISNNRISANNTHINLYSNSDVSYNGGTYPTYLYINNDASSPEYLRSNDLSYNTVDVSLNTYFPVDVCGNVPVYTRYTAEKFSKIYYNH